MNFSPDNLYHIYNQGNNHQNIFADRNDFLMFLKEIRRLILPHTDIVAYCLMPNHFHLLVYTDERIVEQIKQGGLVIDKLTNGIRKLLSGYARMYNKKYKRSGSLFRQKTKNKLISDESIVVSNAIPLQDYCANCFHYIHQNPWKGGLVAKLEDWEFSSFSDYAGLRNGTLCNKSIAEKYCYYNAENFIAESYKEILLLDYENTDR